MNVQNIIIALLLVAMASVCAESPQYRLVSGN